MSSQEFVNNLSSINMEFKNGAGESFQGDATDSELGTNPSAGPLPVHYEPMIMAPTAQLMPRTATAKQVNPINSTSIGMKRKAGARVAGTKMKKWTCDLCDVSTTHHNGLLDHYKGKTHKARETMASSRLLQGECFNIEEMRVIKNGDDAEVEVKQKEGRIKCWCQVCKFEAYTEEEIISHMLGQKHKVLIRVNGGCVIAVDPTMGKYDEDLETVNGEKEDTVSKLTNVNEEMGGDNQEETDDVRQTELETNPNTVSDVIQREIVKAQIHEEFLAAETTLLPSESKLKLPMLYEPMIKAPTMESHVALALQLNTPATAKEVNSINATSIGMKRKAEALATCVAGIKKKKWMCDLCDVSISSESDLQMHFNGRKHKAKERIASSSVTDSSLEHIAPAISLGSMQGDVRQSELNTILSAVSDVVQREIEKSQIHEEIVASETALLSSKSRLKLPVHYVPMIEVPEMESYGALPLQFNTPAIQLMPQTNTAKQVNLIHSTSVGMKRKSGALPMCVPRNEMKTWTCDLCNVSTPGECVLLAHLKGRKHKAKERIASSSLIQGSFQQFVPPQSLSYMQGECSIKEMIKKADDAEVEVKQKEGRVKCWCQVCKFETDTEEEIISHMLGQKHKDLMREDGGCVIAISTMADK